MIINLCQPDTTILISNAAVIQNSSIDTSLLLAVATAIQSLLIDTSLIIAIATAIQSLLIDTSLVISISSFQCQSKAYFSPNTFISFFGSSANQSISTLVIKKNDLPGLVPSSSNTAQSLVAGILNKLLSGNNDTEFLKISFNYWGYATDNVVRTDTILINLYDILAITNSYEIAQPSNIINPNNY